MCLPAAFHCHFHCLPTVFPCLSRTPSHFLSLPLHDLLLPFTAFVRPFTACLRSNTKSSDARLASPLASPLRLYVLNSPSSPSPRLLTYLRSRSQASLVLSQLLRSPRGAARGEGAPVFMWLPFAALPRCRLQWEKKARTTSHHIMTSTGALKLP